MMFEIVLNSKTVQVWFDVYGKLVGIRVRCEGTFSARMRRFDLALSVMPFSPRFLPDENRIARPITRALWRSLSSLSSLCQTNSIKLTSPLNPNSILCLFWRFYRFQKCSWSTFDHKPLRKSRPSLFHFNFQIRSTVYDYEIGFITVCELNILPSQSEP